MVLAVGTVSQAEAESVRLRLALAELRNELRELAFTLDRRGQFEAADVASMVAGRVEELAGADAEYPNRGSMEEGSPEAPIGTE